MMNSQLNEFLESKAQLEEVGKRGSTFEGHTFLSLPGFQVSCPSAGALHHDVSTLPQA
jgi:hypothetical protein